MPCVITTRSAYKKLRDENSNKKMQKQNIHGKSPYLILRAPSNNVKLQPDKTLTTQIYFFLTTQGEISP